MRKRTGHIFILLGVILILAACGLIVSNLTEEQKAGELSQIALDSLIDVIPADVPTVPSGIPTAELIPEDELEYPDYWLNPDMPMPEYEIDGVGYIGQLEIPDLSLELPIITETTGKYLRIAPCRYTGSAYTHDLVIGAHNYARHFGNIGDLSYGALVILTDMDGNRFRYQVANIEILQPGDVDILCSGEWPLTLYTCTIGGRTRITVRCELLDGND